MSDKSLSKITEAYGFSVDGFVVDEVAQTTESSGFETKSRLDPSIYRFSDSSSSTSNPGQQFRERGWSSNSEPADKDEEVVLQFRFDQERSFNRLSFELFNVPQYFSVYYFDNNRKTMTLLSDQRSNPVQGYVSGIKEPVVGQGVAWVKQAFVLEPFKTNLLEIRLKRDSAGVSALGLNPKFAYKLKIRKLYLRFHVVPPTPGPGDNDPPDDVVLPPDLEDFPQLKLLSFSASEAMNEGSGFWHSPPLGPGSVYPFIVDLRDNNGSSQTFDTIKMIPLYTGSLMNVYYSNDETIGNFHLSTNRKNLTINKNGAVATVISGDWQIDKGILISNDAYWSVPNSDMRLHTFNSFTVGMQVEGTQFNTGTQHIATLQGANANVRISFIGSSSTSSSGDVDVMKAECSDYKATFTIPDHSFNVDNFIKISGITLSQYNGVWKVVDTTTDTVTVENKASVLSTIGDTETAIGIANMAETSTGTLRLAVGTDQINLNSVQFVESYKYGIGFSFDKSTNTWSVFKSEMNKSNVASATKTNVDYNGEFVNQLFLGNSNYSFDGFLANVWVRQEAFSNNVWQVFLRNTKRFMNGSGKKNVRTNGHFNTLFAASLMKDYEYQFGPNRFYYNAKIWKPVNRDFILNTDTYNMGIPVKAKFVKLEFTKPTGRYYNPATLENILLPIYSYPSWIRKWFFANNSFDSKSVTYNTPNTFFERSNNLQGGFRSDYGLINIKSAIDGSVNSTIFSPDQAGVDFILDAEGYDEFILQQQVRNSSIHMKFPISGQHNYQLTYVPMRNKKAYFYGIQSLKFIRTDLARSFDNKAYIVNANDDNWFETSEGFIERNDVLVADTVGSTIVSKDFESFNSFNTLQFGVLQSPIVDLLSFAKINLVEVDHLSRTDSESIVETVNNVRGSSDGQTVWLKRIQDGPYGIQTDTVSLPSTTSDEVSGGITLVAGCRLRSLSSNPTSTYELRLQTFVSDEWQTAAVKRFIPDSNFIWGEYEVTYLTQDSETDFRLQIVQTDSASNEELYIDMLGLWMSSFKYEIGSFEEGTFIEYLPIVYNVSNASGLLNIPVTNKLRIKVTSLIPGAWISGWTAIPHYLNTPINLATYIAKQSDWGASDDLVNRLASRQIFFNDEATKALPRRYSIYNNVIGTRTVY